MDIYYFLWKMQKDIHDSYTLILYEFLILNQSEDTGDCLILYLYFSAR